MGAEQSIQCLVAGAVGDAAARKCSPPGRSTIFIFDWDDTLLCSSAVRLRRWTVEELEALEVAVESILRAAMSLGETMIVTNGNATWVEESASRFLPGLMPLLLQLRVVSARALYEDTYPDDPFMWKQAAFELLLTKERHFSAEAGVNLIAVGDQFPEIDAARNVGASIGGKSFVKTVKFREQPSAADVRGQLQSLEKALPRIATGRGSQSYGLVRELGLFEPFSSKALGWRCVAEHELSDPGCMGPTMGMGMKEIVGLFTH